MRAWLGGKLAPSLCGAALVGLGVNGSGFAAPATWQPDAPSYGVYTRNDIPIKMRDGVVLRANIGVPVPGGGTALDPKAKFPVLVSQTPYRKDGGLFTVDSYFVS